MMRPPQILIDITASFLAVLVLTPLFVWFVYACVSVFTK